MSNPNLLPETRERISAEQSPVRPPTLEDRAAVLRVMIARKVGSPTMLANWRKDLQKILDEIEAGEACKTNPYRTHLNVQFKSFLELFDEDEDGSDTSMSGQLRDAGFGDAGPM